MTSWDNMLIFYTTAENPIPLETDEALRLEATHKAMKRSWLSVHIVLGVLFLLLKGTAALIQPVCDKRFVGCVAGAGEGVRLLFQAVFTVTVLFVLTIVVVTVSVRL